MGLNTAAMVEQDEVRIETRRLLDQRLRKKRILNNDRNT